MSLLTEQEITEIVREAARGSATRRDGSTSQRIARAIESKVIEKIKAQGPVARTVASVTNTGYVYIEAMDRTIPFRTNLYRIPEGD